MPPLPSETTHPSQPNNDFLLTHEALSAQAFFERVRSAAARNLQPKPRWPVRRAAPCSLDVDDVLDPANGWIGAEHSKLLADLGREFGQAGRAGHRSAQEPSRARTRPKAIPVQGAAQLLDKHGEKLLAKAQTTIGRLAAIATPLYQHEEAARSDDQAMRVGFDEIAAGQVFSGRYLDWALHDAGRLAAPAAARLRALAQGHADLLWRQKNEDTWRLTRMLSDGSMIHHADGR